jgi:ribosomal protein L37E
MQCQVGQLNHERDQLLADKKAWALSHLEMQRQLQSEREAKADMARLTSQLRDISLKKVSDESRIERIFQELENTKRLNEKLMDEYAYTKQELGVQRGGEIQVTRTEDGDLLARCRRCGAMYNVNSNDNFSCGFHSGKRNGSGQWGCCGDVEVEGQPPMYCQYGPHKG